MATITHSDAAPSEKVHYSIGQVEFDLDAGGSFETEDRAVIASAESHPNLVVERPDVEEFQADVAQDRTLAPEDDSLSAVNSSAFDLDAVRATEEAKAGAVVDTPEEVATPDTPVPAFDPDDGENFS